MQAWKTLATLENLSYLATPDCLREQHHFLFFPTILQCNRESPLFSLSFYHFRFSVLLINLSAFASTISGMQQHDTGMILDISTASHRPALKSMSFVNFIYSLINKGTSSSTAAMPSVCVPMKMTLHQFTHYFKQEFIFTARSLL